MTRESTIEKKIVAFAKQRGFLTFKFTSPGQKGVPDRCFISPYGTVLFLEIKAPGNRPTPIQFQTLNKLRKSSVAATWTNCADQGMKMIVQLGCVTADRFNWMYDLCE